MLERLQKIIAHAGIASRRHAEQLILSGQVLVNGQIVRELGTKADPTVDRIEAAGRTVEEARKPVYLIMHKPPEVVSSLADPAGRKTLRNFLRGFPERVYPVGNLDYAASGLIFMTNDGLLTDKILKSWSNIPQVYHIKVKGRLNLDELDALGSKTSTIVRVVRQPDSTRGHAQNFWYEAQVAGSKLDLLAEALQKSGHPVEKVKRIGLGPLSLEGVPVGHYALLSKQQVEALNHPSRPFKFIPHPKPKPEPRPLPRPAASFEPRPHPSAPSKAQHFSNPPAKRDGRPARYTKFQRRPSSPPNTREEPDDDFDDERLDIPDKPRAPWLRTDRPAQPPAIPSAKFRGGTDSRSDSRRDSKPFRPKGPHNFSASNKPQRPAGSSNKFARPGNSSGEFNRPGSSSGKFARPGNPSGNFNRPTNSANRFDRRSPGHGKPPRPSSGRSKSQRSFPPRKPRPPR
jgi:23S rRNA pseudouridine2605 synthase